MNSIVRGMLITLALAAFAGAASARPINSRSVKYFDENGSIVGQQYLLCDGRSGHGGNTHTAYTIEEETICSGGQDERWIVPGKIIVAYTLPGSVTLDAACSVGNCEDNFVPEVGILGLWPYTVGWQ